MSEARVAVVIGVGPEDGLGSALCKRFATRGMHVFVAGRTRAKLDAIVDVIAASGGQATAHIADATSEDDIKTLFDAAAQTGNFAQALAKEVAGDGIHVGHVVVDGPIGGEKIKAGFPEYAEQLGEHGMISLEGIVDAFEFLANQPPSAWSFEVDVRTSRERW